MEFPKTTVFVAPHVPKIVLDEEDTRVPDIVKLDIAAALEILVLKRGEYEHIIPLWAFHHATSPNTGQDLVKYLLSSELDIPTDTVREIDPKTGFVYVMHQQPRGIDIKDEAAVHMITTDLAELNMQIARDTWKSCPYALRIAVPLERWPNADVETFRELTVKFPDAAMALTLMTRHQLDEISSQYCTTIGFEDKSGANHAHAIVRPCVGAGKTKYTNNYFEYRFVDTAVLFTEEVNCGLVFVQYGDLSEQHRLGYSPAQLAGIHSQLALLKGKAPENMRGDVETLEQLLRDPQRL